MLTYSTLAEADYGIHGIASLVRKIAARLIAMLSRFDRDLGLAGRAMIKSKDGTIRHRLINLHRPLLRIPTLAIHLDRQEKFEFSKETQLFPIAGMVAAELERSGVLDQREPTSAGQAKEPKSAENFSEPLKPMQERHHPHLVSKQAFLYNTLRPEKS